MQPRSFGAIHGGALRAVRHGQASKCDIQLCCTRAEGRREQSGRKIGVTPPVRFYSRRSPICSLAYPPPLGVRFWKVLEGCVDELRPPRARSTRSGRARSTRSGATGWKRVVLRATVSDSRHLLHERVSRRAGISGFRVQGSAKGRDERDKQDGKRRDYVRGCWCNHVEIFWTSRQEIFNGGWR
jgi:hypothetical protein